MPITDAVRLTDARPLQRTVCSRFSLAGCGDIVALLLFITVGSMVHGLAANIPAFVAAEGSVPDYAARVAGFAIRTITISGARALTQQEVITASGIGPKNSLPFLDVQAVRARLKTLPMVKECEHHQAFSRSLVIDVEERKPYALWQKDGTVKIVAMDGTAIRYI